jgi:peptide-methionine (R)-S-oxide reductase
MSSETYPVTKSDAVWKAELSAEQYRVLRKHGTERAGASVLNAEKRAGAFVCAACAQALFESGTKFESGTGWPSFYAPIDMRRVEVHCARCGGHLGHVFPDGPKPTGLRFCMNGAALTFKPAE